jgi:hypothetical protein
MLVSLVRCRHDGRICPWDGSARLGLDILGDIFFEKDHDSGG